MGVFDGEPEYPEMKHGFPRSYIPQTPQEILYDHDRILGSRARMYSQGETMLRQPRLETTAYTMVTEGELDGYFAQMKTGKGDALKLANAIVEAPWVPFMMDLALLGLGLYTFWVGRENMQKVIGGGAIILGGGMLGYHTWLVSGSPEISYKEEAVSTEE
jgi:hypothetical protein